MDGREDPLRDHLVNQATFYRQATDSVAYWRCELPAKYLPGKVVNTTELRGRKRPDKRVDFLVSEDGEPHEGAAIFQFPSSHEESLSMMIMQAQGIPTFVEVDDNYTQHDPLFMARSNWAQTIKNGKLPHSVQGHCSIVRNYADGVIVTTPVLAEAYAELNQNVHICRNSIDPDDWPELEKPDDGVLRFGWYASLSHDRDAPLIRKAMSWASRQPNVEVMTLGLDPAGWDFARTHYPWEHHVVLRKWLQRIDVGMAPVVRTTLADGRSDLKVLEYSMAGAVTIASDVPPYAWWKDKPAMLAYNAAEFMEYVQFCVKNRDAVREMGRLARERVLRDRTYKTEIESWRAALASVKEPACV